MSILYAVPFGAALFFTEDNMKKRILALIVAATAALCTLGAFGCNSDSGSGSSSGIGSGSGNTGTGGSETGGSGEHGGSSSGNAHTAHTFDQKNTDIKYLAQEATLTSKARYYYSCKCGEIGTETFEYGKVLQATEGLEFTLSENETYYSVTGIGEVTETDIVIPDTHENKPVKAIGDSAFFRCKELTSVYIPDSVVNIGNMAFGACINITAFKIPYGVVNIGKSAFGGCISITSMHLPDSVKTIGDGAFWLCTKLTDLQFGNGIESLGHNIVAECLSLTTFKFPEGIKELTCDIQPEGDILVDGYGLSWCFSLESVYIPSSVEKIERGALACDRITFYCEAESKPSGWNEECFGNSGTTAGIAAGNLGTPPAIVWNCKNNNKDDVGYEHASIDGISYSFKEGKAYVAKQVCTLGGKIDVDPKNLFDEESTYIDYVYSYGDVTIPDKVNYKDKEFPICGLMKNAFDGCIVLNAINLPDAITEIPDYAFCAAFNLKNLIIPDNVKSIGYNAFWNCDALNEVTMPANITEFDKGAFYGCDKLATINFKGNKEQWLAIKKGKDWNIKGGSSDVIDFTVICSDGNLDKDGNEIE